MREIEREKVVKREKEIEREKEREIPVKRGNRR